MTDDLTPTDEVEDAPTPVEGLSSEPTSEEEPQDVGALKRALDREREERKAAKEELRRIREDEDARREFLAELGYEIAEDEGEPDEDDDEERFETERPKELEELLRWKQQQEAKEGQERFEKDLGEFAADRQVSKVAKDWIALETSRTGNSPAALKKAVESWFAAEDELRASGRDDYRKSKKAPHVSPVGKSATKTPDLDNDDERVAWMAQRVADLEASG